MRLVRPRRRVVAGPLTTWPVGPIAGMVFWTSSRQPRLRSRVVRRRRRRRIWLTQNVCFKDADTGWGRVCYLQRLWWTAQGRKRQRTSYQQYMSINISRLLRGDPIWYGPEELKPVPAEEYMALYIKEDKSAMVTYYGDLWMDIDPDNLTLDFHVEKTSNVSLTFQCVFSCTTYDHWDFRLRANAIFIGGTGGVLTVRSQYKHGLAFSASLQLPPGDYQMAPQWRGPYLGACWDGAHYARYLKALVVEVPE